MDTKNDVLCLAPCPFCGGGARRSTGGNTNAWFGTGCDGDQSCPAHLRALMHKTQAEADSAWNRRAPADASKTATLPAGMEIEFKQFLSDAITAAGLVTHGKRCKALGSRLGEMAFRLLTAPQPPALKPQTDEHETALSLLCGLHPCMTIDGPPMVVAERIFDAVIAERRELTETIKQMESWLETMRNELRTEQRKPHGQPT